VRTFWIQMTTRGSPNNKYCQRQNINMVLIQKSEKNWFVEHTPHRVTFQGCVRVFDGGWVSKQHLEFFSSHSN
jgi:hypothetical protein